MAYSETPYPKGIAMFKLPNAIQIKAVATTDNEETVTPVVKLPTPDEVAEYATIAGYWGKQSAKVVSILYVGKKVVDTAQEIAVIAAAARLVK